METVVHHLDPRLSLRGFAPSRELDQEQAIRQQFMESKDGLGPDYQRW